VSIPPAALIPLIVLALVWIGICLVDLARSEILYLPKWLWAVIIVISVPLGGIIYMTLGRAPR
jgi:hypothetical protein